MRGECHCPMWIIERWTFDHGQSLIVTRFEYEEAKDINRSVVPRYVSGTPEYKNLRDASTVPDIPTYKIVLKRWYRDEQYSGEGTLPWAIFRF